MAWSDVANAIESLAPTIASVIGGPLAGTGVTALEKVFGLEPKANQTIAQRTDQVAQAIAGATPEQLIDVQKAENDFKVQMAQLGFHNAEALAALAVQDVSNARAMQISTRSRTQPALAWLVILASIAFMAAVVFGCVHLGDPVTANMVGNVQGYIFSEAKAVLQFYFGGSMDSARKTELLAQSAPVQE